MALRSSYLTIWTPDKVQQAADEHAADGPVAFASYAQQELGVAYPTVKDMAILRKKIKEFFALYDTADYHTLCRIVFWAKNRKRKKRFNKTWALVEAWRDALAQGALPELERGAVDPGLEAEIQRALEVEQRPEWRRRLLGAAGAEARQKAILDWEASRL